MRIRGGCAILWRQQGVSQIGTSPGRRTIVSDLSLAEQRLLDELARSLEAGGVYRAARRSRVPVTRARQIVEDLERQGVLVSSATSELGGADGVYWDRLGADARGRGAALAQAVLAVHGISALAQETALWLAEAGVGTILSTRSPKEGGLEPLLSARFPAVRTRAPLRTRPDVMVTVDAHVVEPLLARRLAQEDVVHLPVVVGEAGVRVGPVLGRGGLCSTCLDLWERDADPCWPALATQMRTLPMPDVEHLALHEAAALTARAVIDTLLGRTGAVDGAAEAADDATANRPEAGGALGSGSDAWWATHSVEVTGQEPLGRARSWERHPECLCSRL
ncbi:hypothetical protein E4J66_11305 [Actinomyces viscosus]|uniref:Uncharacterized protein n=1 Tax=Actinomyces viscosus TaxID=1656 RepID=A0A3S4Z1M6_ACTVI|nr:hypothetical protein [Actinomyces viscosus]TFH51605.1 hypothetical protein E4J66_11305 [Actinomyces viscosus]VEI15721.1 Uncharacterised protein [Actinomyces viscosus]